MYYLFIYYCLFKIKSQYEALAVLELTMLGGLKLTESCLPLLPER